MSSGDDDDIPATYASPPCLMHELDPCFLGLAHAADPQGHKDVMRWRKAERKRLIADRLATAADWRRGAGERISQLATEAIGDLRGLTISAYWPFRGEPDLRDLIATLSSKAICALPVVVAPGRPLVFRAWKPGERLERGIWDIPVPADGREVTPDVVIAPVVGFDSGCYRLGYGGGFFDRTLAALPVRPRFLGVGYSRSAVATIYPQPHDLPMDLVVTETGVVHRTREADPAHV